MKNIPLGRLYGFEMTLNDVPEADYKAIKQLATEYFEHVRKIMERADREKTLREMEMFRAAYPAPHSGK